MTAVLFSKRREQFTHPNGVTTQNILLLNTQAVETSNRCFLIVNDIFLSDYIIFLIFRVLFITD